MPARPPREATTDEHRPPTGEHARSGRPALLAAFPAQALVSLPPSGAVVGRPWLLDAGVEDSKVSSSHLRFHRAGAQLQIEDVGSRNGTWVDGHKLPNGERVSLDDGSVVRIGRTLLVYREAFDGPSKPEPPLGGLVGPWGLGGARAAIAKLGRVPAARVGLLNVLIEAESGTGKELLADAVVQALGRERPFERVNVTTLAPSVIESHLFGWTRSAFSGSGEGGPGLIRACQGGAVFLDEIGELPRELQPKLLRVLQDRDVMPVGAPRVSKVDVVVVAATNRLLEEEVQQGGFRLDLLARFPVRLDLPPLHERSEDLFAILAALWKRAHGDLDLDRVRVDVEAVELMMLHRSRENVRALDRVIMAVDPAEGLKLSVVEQVLRVRADSVAAPPLSPETIQAALQECNGNQTRAAAKLGINRAKLLRLLKAMERGGASRGRPDQNR